MNTQVNPQVTNLYLIRKEEAPALTTHTSWKFSASSATVQMNHKWRQTVSEKPVLKAVDPRE